MNDLKSAVKKLNDRVEQNPVNFSEIVKQQVTGSLEAVSDDLHDVKHSIEQTKEHGAERRDKENRRNNIILYRVPESDEMRAEERNKADVAFCLRLFNNCIHTGITEDDPINVFRLGHNQDPDTLRPVMIQFASYTSKNLTMESLYRLKNTEKKFKGVVIAHDVTRTERDECKRLVAEAKDNTSGEFMYRVRGPPGNLRIVKIKLDPNLDEFTVLYTNIDCLPNKIQELSQYTLIYRTNPQTS